MLAVGGADLTLTRLNSVDTLQWMPRALEEEPSLKIVVMAVSDREETAKEAVRLHGACDYILLPCRDEGTVLDLVDRMMQRLEL